MSELSTKPYLIRAIHEWCADSGYRPYIAVVVDDRTQVPFEFVRNGEIVLNVSPEATNHLVIGNDLIEFEARFNRVARNVSVPIANVSAIYAAENGHGMAFDVPKALAVVEPDGLPEGQGAPAGAPTELSSVPTPRRRAPARTPATARDADAPPAVSLVPRLTSTEPPADQPSADQPSGDSVQPLAPVSSGSDAAGSSGETPTDDDPAPSTPPGRKSARPKLTRVK